MGSPTREAGGSCRRWPPRATAPSPTRPNAALAVRAAGRRGAGAPPSEASIRRSADGTRGVNEAAARERSAAPPARSRIAAQQWWPVAGRTRRGGEWKACPRARGRSSALTGGDALLLRVHLLDHVVVLREDRRAADLLGPRELVVVGVQLLVEEREPADPGDGGEVLVHARHRLRDQAGHLTLAREVLE